MKFELFDLLGVKIIVVMVDYIFIRCLSQCSYFLFPLFDCSSLLCYNVQEHYALGLGPCQNDYTILVDL